MRENDIGTQVLEAAINGLQEEHLSLGWDQGL